MNQSGLLPAQITQFTPPNKNTPAKNEANTKAKNEANTKAKNSNKSSANELLNTIKEKIEIDRKNLPVWILLLIANILIILHYVTTPIRYSND